MRMQPARPQWCAAVIERADNHVLIVLPADGEEHRRWIFPRGAAVPPESAEAAMRRIARDQLGLIVELVIGQPPLPFEIGGHTGEIRYFFCGVEGGEARRGPYREIRWVSKGHLREYEFDAASAPVVEWILAP